jgi:hypothetical protein
MMFDPTSLGESLKPGDKMSLHFHKGQPKASGPPSFMDNVQAAQPAPGGAMGQAGPAAPQGPVMSPSAPPPNAGGGFSGMSSAMAGGPTSGTSMGAVMPSVSMDANSNGGTLDAGEPSGYTGGLHSLMAAALQRRMMGGQ